MVTIEFPDGMSVEEALEQTRSQRPELFAGREPPRASRAPQPEPLLTPAEVATLFKVDVKTVTRWAVAGKLHSIRTPGGHRRFFGNQVSAMLRGATWELPPEYANAA